LKIENVGLEEGNLPEVQLTEHEIQHLQEIGERQGLNYGELNIKAPFKGGELQEAKLGIEHIVRKRSSNRVKS